MMCGVDGIFGNNGHFSDKTGMLKKGRTQPISSHALEDDELRIGLKTKTPE